MNLWAADPHQYGPGKVHAIDEDKPDQTYCGKVMSAFPGRPVVRGNVTCKICCDSPEKRKSARARSEQWRLQYEAEQAEKERQAAEELRQRRERYHAYLKTPKWFDIRARVMKRAGGTCEGCARRPAVQVHHLTYEHVGDEFMWELRAVCIECHERFHAKREGQ